MLGIHTMTVFYIFLFKVSEEEEIPVHRFMLSCQSPVFRTMFQDPKFKENQTGRIIVKDVSHETLLALVK